MQQNDRNTKFNTSTTWPKQVKIDFPTPYSYAHSQTVIGREGNFKQKIKSGVNTRGNEPQIDYCYTPPAYLK